MATTMGILRATIGSAWLLAGCAVAEDPAGNDPASHDSGRSFVVDTGSPATTTDSGRDTRSAPVDEDSAPPDEDTAVADYDSGVVSPIDSGSVGVDTAIAPIDTSIFTDTTPAETTPPVDSGCGGPVATGMGASCTAPVPVSMDMTCTQEITGDTCTGITFSTSCGAGQGLVHTLQVSSGVRLYDIKVSTGFQLATIPGPPLCGGAGSCVGTGMSTGVSAGSAQWWVVMKVGGGCGAYTLTITPR